LIDSTGCRSGVGTIRTNLVKKTITKECVGLAGKRCNSKSNCVINSKCSNGICICDAGFSKSSEGTCGIAYGLPCGKTQACSDSFLCTSGTCRCPSTKHQIFDTKVNQHKCLGLIRGPCVSDLDCIPLSHCVTKEHTNYKQCTCESGYVENPSGGCDLAEGSVCDYNSTISECDRIAELECINGACACPDTLTRFDPILRRCLGLDGTRCKIEENTFEQVCVDNAQCVTPYSKLEGTCSCNPGFNSTNIRLCAVTDPASVKIHNL